MTNDETMTMTKMSGLKMGFICLLMAMGAMGAVADDKAKVEGALKLDKKTYTLKQALAYETTIDNEDAVAVVLSAQAVTSEQLKEARKAEKENGDPTFNRPFLRLVFKKTGEMKYWSAGAGGTTIGRHSAAAGELKIEGGRVTGNAKVSEDPQGMFPSSFDIKFETALVKANESLPESTAKKGGPAANVPATVSGVFKGNGKDAKLAFVSAHWQEPFSGKTGIALVFTEKDHSKDKKPDSAAMFGRFGNALIISIHEDGGIYGCQVVHSALKNQGFSSVGNIEAPEFTYADGKVEGVITTNGQVETFGGNWEVNLKFVAPLGEVPKEFEVAKEPEKKKEEKATNDSGTDEEDSVSDLTKEKPAAKPSSGGLKAKELALTKDATDVEYKSVVEQLVFKSKSDVKKVCAELSANLKAQGWTNDGSDMIQPQSSILKRKRSDAKLTIFVTPSGGGSEVKMMTEGLSWE
jgi:hypothetical protein